MSGPIVRKYGFPNFEQIFGKRDLEHGVEGKKPVDPLHRETDDAVKQTEEAVKSKSAEASAPKS